MTGWKWIVLLILVAVGASGIWGYDRYSARYPSTENAYIDADAIHVAAQVGGPVVELAVGSQQFVSKGDLLLRVDEAPYRAALNKSLAELALAHRQVRENHAALAAAQAGVDEAHIAETNAFRHWQRVSRLKPESYLSEDDVENARSRYERARADSNVAKARLAEASAKVNENGGRDDLVAQAEASVADAQWRLDRTHINASCDGYTEQLGLGEGDTVRAQVPLFVLVCSEQFWVKANFKETEISRIQVGQPVDIHIDMFDDREFQGIVESISPASGTAFSMLPPENATGNWVKVTQRIPVRIRILNVNDSVLLRIGASAHVRIDTEVREANTVERANSTAVKSEALGVGTEHG